MVKTRVRRDGSVWRGKEQIGFISDHAPIHPRYVGYTQDGRQVFASAVRDLVVNAIARKAT